ncbi:MAG: cytochrome c biosis factor [Acidimicrobiales bacterium]|jgi:cytochrome c-type biogenesis protein CcmF|nr:cytochrome c biosis factor [Acidimicrobiales bacterium]
MSAVLGSGAVVLGLVASLLGIVTIGVGLRRRDPRLLAAGRSYAWVILSAAVMATFAMELALVRHDFSLRYVAANGSRTTPLLFTITGMWSALEGSILLWSLVLAGYLALMVRHFRDRVADPLVGWATLTVFVVTAFFFGLMTGPANPFRLVSGATPLDGPGPNPLLQNHPLVAFHPPLLYLGYVGFTIPFAFAVAALVTGRLGEGWLVETRRWTLFAWGFLTIGIVLGAWWSYEVLGWGGYWAWDPVENASFIPWLTATAYVHSVMVQERRGMLRIWNLSLLLATFSLTILGTFLTRSGVLDSVHAFSESSIGPLILGFFALIVAVSVVLIGWRGDRLRSPGTIDSPVSREGAFLANNVLFAAFAFVVLLGTVFPLLAEAMNGDRISVGGPYFNRMTGPVGFTLLFLMAIAPALPWRKASGELLSKRLLWPAWSAAAVVAVCVVGGLRGFTPLLAFALGGFAGGAAVRQLVLSARRQGRRGLIGRANGGMVVHLGVVLIAVAFAASHAYSHSHEFTLKPGQSAELAGHHVTYLGTNTETHGNKTSISARVRIDGGKVYAPALQRFPFATQAIGSPSVKTGWRDDVYLTLVSPPDTSAAEPDAAVVGVLIEPMMMWLWIGGGLMGIGTFLAAWPGRRRRLPTAPVSEPLPELAGVG